MSVVRAFERNFLEDFTFLLFYCNLRGHIGNEDIFLERQEREVLGSSSVESFRASYHQ